MSVMIENVNVYDENGKPLELTRITRIGGQDSSENAMRMTFVRWNIDTQKIEQYKLDYIPTPDEMGFPIYVCNGKATDTSSYLMGMMQMTRHSDEPPF